MLTGETDIPVVVGEKDVHVVPLKVPRHAPEVGCVAPVVQRGEPSGDEDLLPRDPVQKRQSQVGGPLLRSEIGHHVETGGEQEVPIAPHLAPIAVHLVPADVEFLDLDAVMAAAASRHPEGGDGHLVAACRKALGKLLHHLLHAARLGVVLCHGVQNPHGLSPSILFRTMISTAGARSIRYSGSDPPAGRKSSRRVPGSSSRETRRSESSRGSSRANL